MYCGVGVSDEKKGVLLDKILKRLTKVFSWES